MFNFIPSIDRYIFRLTIVPMLGVFALAASLLLLDQMLRLFDFVAVEGGPVGVVFKMLIALVPEYASLAKMLGEKLYYALVRGKVSRAEIRDLLAQPFASETESAATYFQWVTRVAKTRIPSRI